MPSATSTNPDRTRRSPRERLLEAAGELFYAEGVQSVGIDRVIERAGVAKASPTARSAARRNSSGPTSTSGTPASSDDFTPR
jgi:hypothetical protein